jgi:hypothetical protein
MKWMKILENEGEVDLNGFKVEALDGAAGRIEQMLYWSDAKMPDYVVVDTGRWLFGHKSVLSIRTIEDIDVENRSLKIALSKRQIREAPEFLPCS